MNKKMTIGATVVAVVAIGVGSFVAGTMVAPGSVNIPVGGEKQNTNSMRVVAVYDTANPMYVIAMEYPQFDRASDVFNGKIAEWANAALADFKKNSTDNWKARQETAPTGQPKEEYPKNPFTFSITWASKQINENAISIIVRMDSYEGGANGRQELKTFNYDVANKKEMTLADLFPGDTGYLGKVSEYAHDRLVGDLVVGEDEGGDVLVNMITEGTAPTARNFENFMFNSDVIDVYFPKYQVVPGSYGEQHVIMPRRGI